MTAPNIEAIAASLRNCSLGGRTEAPEQQQPVAREVGTAVGEVAEEYDGVTVELNSEVALPYHWEQCLDITTGEVYYINWKDGTRTNEDPRLTVSICRTSYDISKDDTSEEDDFEPEEDDESYCDGEDSSSSAGDGAEYDDFHGTNANISAGNSHGASPSNSETQGSDAGTSASAGENVLVAAGCKSCFMYYMVSKRVDICPKCGGCLLHLGRNGYI